MWMEDWAIIFLPVSMAVYFCLIFLHSLSISCVPVMSQDLCPCSHGFYRPEMGWNGEGQWAKVISLKSLWNTSVKKKKKSNLSPVKLLCLTTNLQEIQGWEKHAELYYRVAIGNTENVGNSKTSNPYSSTGKNVGDWWQETGGTWTNFYRRVYLC